MRALLQDVEMKPQHDYFVNFPGVSRWHWHPLTCLYPQGQQGQPGGSVTFCMKQKGKWSTVRAADCQQSQCMMCVMTCNTIQRL